MHGCVLMKHGKQICDLPERFAAARGCGINSHGSYPSEHF